MGTDKAQLRFAGISLLERTVRAAQGSDCSVVVVGREPPGGWSQDTVRFVLDDTPAMGPLGGLDTALRCTGTSVLLVACDMPQLSTQALRWLLDTASERSLEHGVAVVNGGRVEPLFSVYTPACRPLIARQSAHGRRSLRALIEAGCFAHVSAPHDIVPALVNVNTPEEFAALDRCGPPGSGAQ